MTDRREAILAQLETLLGGNDGGYNVYRNKEDLTENMQPAFVLFDAHEERDSIGERITIQTNGFARVRMTPRIGLYVADAPENVGTLLNSMRIMVLKLIFPNGLTPDPILASIITPSGAVFYDGCGNQLDRGAEMVGEMILNFSFFYPLLPADFLAS